MRLLPSCKDVTNQSSDYLDRQLSLWQRLGFWVHIMMCVHCKRYLDQLKLTIATLAKLPGSQPPSVDDAKVAEITRNLKDACQHKHD